MEGFANHIIDMVEEIELELKYEYFGDIFNLEDLYDDDWFEDEEDDENLFE